MIDISPIPILGVINQLACIDWEKPVRSHGELVHSFYSLLFLHLQEQIMSKCLKNNHTILLGVQQ